MNKEERIAKAHKADRIIKAFNELRSAMTEIDSCGECPLGDRIGDNSCGEDLGCKCPADWKDRTPPKSNLREAVVHLLEECNKVDGWCDDCFLHNTGRTCPVVEISNMLPEEEK